MYQEHKATLQRQNQKNSNKKKKLHFLQLQSVLQELLVRKIMPFTEVFQHYCSGIRSIQSCTYEEKKKFRQNFKAKVLSLASLPVLILNFRSNSFVILVERWMNSHHFISGLNGIIKECIDEYSREGNLLLIRPYFKMLMTLFSTNRDRSPVYWLLNQLFSMTSLEQHLFISRKIRKDVEDQLHPIIKSTELKINSLNKEADKHAELMKHNLKASIDKEEKLLEQKRKRLSENLISDKEFDIENKRQRLESLEQNSKRFKFQSTYRKLGRWRSSIRSSFGKNKGKYRINRVAEDVIYQRLVEHAKAHRRRHGELNTNYLDEDSQRLESREMYRIANDALKQLNCRLIKSKETVRKKLFFWQAKE